MTVRVSRADLLAFLANHKDGDLETIADCYGFDLTVQSSKKEVDDTVPSLPLSEKVLEAPPTEQAAQQKPIAHFHYPVEIEPSQLVPKVDPGEPIKLPEWFEDERVPHSDSEFLKDLKPPPPKPKTLIPKERLWPFLHRILSETTRNKRPDIPRLVKIVADGNFPSRIPCQGSTNWASNAMVLLDFPERLRLFGNDYKSLLQSLRKLRGETGLHIQQVKNYPGGKVTVGTGVKKKTKKWKLPLPGEPVLILGDVGLLGSSSTRHDDWLKFGNKLRKAGCVVYLLTPLPPRYLTREVISLFHCIHWGKNSSLQLITSANADSSVKKAIQADTKRITNTLLPWLSPALLIEPPLLRAVCNLLSLYEDRPYDVGIETLCYVHNDVKPNSVGLRIVHDKISHYREKLAKLATKNPRLAEQIYTLLQKYHGHKALFEFAQEVETLLGTNMIAKDALAEGVETYWKLKVKELAKNPDGKSALRSALYFSLQRQSGQVKKQQDYTSSLWAILQKQFQLDDAIPQWLNPAMAAPFLNKTLVDDKWQAVQAGDHLQLLTRSTFEQLQKKDLKMSSPVFSFSSPASLLVVEFKDQYGQYQPYTRQLDRENGLQIPLTEDPCRLHICGTAYMVSELFSPEWANTMGRDKYGLYADLKIKDTIQRFRWIEPGSFLMGSPEDELERDDDEIQHQVTHSKGYWLADTAVTQGLWKAVMGNNPSKFKDSDNNPVEEVSWEDSMEFIEKLNTLIPGIGAKLPSESQWEYACRAGTTTPFSFGENITPEQVNYFGDIPYAGGQKGLSRHKTVPVKTLPGNKWGLYEMHGNVWEWCSDWYGEYPDKPVDDPQGADTGAVRVVRGGSWSGGGGGVRSAIRDWSGPGLRSDVIGFRLALGHSEHQPARQAGQAGQAGQEQAGTQQSQSEGRTVGGLGDGLRKGLKKNFGV